MTIDRLLLSKLLEKGSDADLLREMMQATLNAMMDLDVETRTGAGYGERTGERTNSRNSYRPRQLDTTVGTLDLAIPKLRVHAKHGSAMTAPTSRPSSRREGLPTRR